ncbi:tubulin/FtsZ family protein [Natrinema gari]|uniref:Tubulin-like protein CetZ n=1 Tax=Natrinema gari JCM 14663 TaxID=1230459 RepID=L9ZFF4_9EURY|nr:tubulin/FtsZ family protein [Natrinema gari]ELY83923.1 Tubulin/FtsZ GTPase [Natrinema gari JCM 14663]
MKLALIGVGHAGSRIVDRALERELETGRDLCNGNVLVFDTAADAFGDITHVPSECQVRFGDIHPDVDADGVGGDPDLGVTVAREDVQELRRAFDAVDFNTIDGLLLVAGLGGGTGGGAGAVLLEELQEICDKPIYALGVLPEADEPERCALTASRALQSFVGIADNVICFDNDAWRSTVSYTDTAESESDRPYDELDRTVVSHVLTAFGASESAAMTTAAENRIDASDITRTLETGGVSSIGRATLELDRSDDGLSWLPSWLPLPSWLEGDAIDGPADAAEVKRLVRRAIDSQLTLPCAVDSTYRVLVVLSGPPTAVSRKGFESARYWLEQETGTVEVLAGDEPRPDSATLTATVLLSTVTDVPRIDALQERGRTAMEAVDESEAGETEFVW